MFVHHKHKMETMTSVWFFPVVPGVVTALSAAIVGKVVDAKSAAQVRLSFSWYQADTFIFSAPMFGVRCLRTLKFVLEQGPPMASLGRNGAYDWMRELRMPIESCKHVKGSFEICTLYKFFWMTSSFTQVFLKLATAEHIMSPITILTLLHCNGALKYFHFLCGQLVYTGYVLWGMTIPLAFFVIAIFFQRLMLHGAPAKESMVSCLLPMGPFGASAVPPLLSFILLLHVFPAKRQGTSCRQAAVKGCHAPTPKLPDPFSIVVHACSSPQG